jgi:Ca-activated chloride channel family protein
LQQGDRTGAATMLQTTAKTALQIGDKGAATVLQTPPPACKLVKNFPRLTSRKLGLYQKLFYRNSPLNNS